MKHHGFSLLEFARQFPTHQERCYTAVKLATDPLYSAVHAALQDTCEPLLDVGCGMGLLAFYLRQRRWLPAITGVDFDERKILTASRLAAQFGEELSFQQADISMALPDFIGSVTALDILQYFSADEQMALLQACARRVSSSGLLVIRTGLTDHSMRFYLTRWADCLAAWTQWLPAPILYPSQGEITRILGEEGLHGSFLPLWGHTPFNNWLGVFRRKTS